MQIQNYIYDTQPAKVVKSLKCVNKLTPEEKDEIIDVISHNNTYLVEPGIWKDSQVTRDKLIRSFISDVDKLKHLNSYITTITDKDNFRIVTFNVHYWTTVDGEENFLEQFRILSIINADIVCIQEALFPTSGETVNGFGFDERSTFVIGSFWEHFRKIGYVFHQKCVASHIHSGENTAFGNIILAKTTPRYAVLGSGEPKGGSESLVDKQGRCFTYVKFSKVDVFNVHLDAFDETGDVRLEQIKTLLSFVSTIKDKPVVLVGDLNSLDYNDYLPKEQKWLNKNRGEKDDRVINEIKSAGFDDVFPRIKYSVWSGRRVDYIWVKGQIKCDNTYAYYTDVSDHFPLFADLKIELSLKADGFKTTGFSWLLWTHNTPADTGLKMMSGEYKNIRCCNTTKIGERIQGRGAQFRWGLDSQYGDFKMIMKPFFWKKYKKGVDPITSKITPFPVFYDFWVDGLYGFTLQAESQLKREAYNYTYRSKTGHEGEFNECDRRERLMYTWCNIQLHIGENVSLDDIAYVLVPAFLKNNENVAKYNTLDFTPGTKKPNPFKGKLIFTGADKIENYYEWIDEDKVVFPNLEEFETFYAGVDNSFIENKESAVKKGVYRNPSHGNSSKFAMNPDSFRLEEEEYIKLLNREGF